MVIRRIVAADDVRMAKIIRASLLEFNAAKPGTVYFDNSTDHLSDLFTERKSAYLIMEVNNSVIGGCGIYPTTGLDDKTCELVKMYIDKEFRGNGYGQTLLEKCMAEAMKFEYEKMYLESMPELTSAIAMYEKNGFTHIGHSLGSSGHNGCNIWMIKDL